VLLGRGGFGQVGLTVLLGQLGEELRCGRVQQAGGIRVYGFAAGRGGSGRKGGPQLRERRLLGIADRYRRGVVVLDSRYAAGSGLHA
jgi:hypothetical protein